MWVWAIFDLPVQTKQERRNATKFRHALLDNGFEMVQYSVYARHVASKEKAERYCSDIAAIVPDYGKVDVLFFTDKQYEAIVSFRGIQDEGLLKKPSQFELF